MPISRTIARRRSRSQGMAIVHGISFVYSDTDGFAESVESNENSADVFRVVGQTADPRARFRRRRRSRWRPAGRDPELHLLGAALRKDPAVIGRVVRKNGAPMTIIGVMPRGFLVSAEGGRVGAAGQDAAGDGPRQPRYLVRRSDAWPTVPPSRALARRSTPSRSGWRRSTRRRTRTSGRSSATSTSSSSAPTPR